MRKNASEDAASPRVRSTLAVNMLKRKVDGEVADMMMEMVVIVG